MNLASRITGTGDPPLETIDDDIISIALQRELDVGGVGRSDEALGHREGGADLALEERDEPLFLLLFCAIASEYLCCRKSCQRRASHPK